MTVRHVLFDADGVLQELPEGWIAALTPWVGDRAEEFIKESVELEQPCLVGDGQFAVLLAEMVQRWGLAVDADELYRAVWHRIDTNDGSLAVVREVRRLGLGVHLATTQEAGRAAVMQQTYAGLFDHAFFSCDVGHQKTETEFFEHVAQHLGAEPRELLFLDDTASNVETARRAGLAAEHWHLTEGHDVLRRRLAGHGVTVDEPDSR